MAILSLLLALASPIVALFVILLPVPALGLLCGLLALRQIRRYPQELTGKVPALIGVIVSAVSLAAGIAGHAYAYATEVPDGYSRISFQDLQPETRQLVSTVPSRAMALDGQKIFIKGYVHPSVDGLGEVRQFILVPDMGTCCFGGTPKLWDMIEVTMTDGDPVKYSRRKRKLAGILKVDPNLKNVEGFGGVLYTLQGEYVQ
jgi:hypothetical protein